ncbi:unnamed protein product [Gadus morhua 'NCC']
MSEPSEQDFPKEHGFSKKLLINCCLVRRIIMWATPAPKGVKRQEKENEQRPQASELEICSCQQSEGLGVDRKGVFYNGCC